MISARLAIRLPDGSWERSTLEITAKTGDEWLDLLARLEARYGPSVGNPPSPLCPTVAAILENLPKPSKTLHASPRKPTRAPQATPEGRPAPLPLAHSEGGVRDTSREALHRHQASGRLGRQEMIVYGYFRSHPSEDFTRQEVAQALGIGINAIAGRVHAIIHDHGLLRETCRRTCRATGESAMGIEAVERLISRKKLPSR